MATTQIRFEVICPLFSDGTNQANAWQTFLTSLKSLTSFVLTNTWVTDVGGNQVDNNQVYGYITSAQQSTALGYLNTLNASLGFNVQCNVWTTTSEP